jgi:protein-tyrosine phosphatase
MPTKLYWLGDAWPGRIALSARPRGGDWLAEEVSHWKRSGIGTVVSLLEPQEEQDLDLRGEEAEIRREGMDFVSFPIPDRQVPRSERTLADALDRMEHSLSSGANVLIHCRQGVGRTGLVAACLLVKKGMSPGAAVEKITVARGVVVPETDEQREWIDHYSAAFTK